MKKLFLALCLAATQAAIAQNADIRIGTLINESNWFELKRTIETTPRDSVSPLLYPPRLGLRRHRHSAERTSGRNRWTKLREHGSTDGHQPDTLRPI